MKRLNESDSDYKIWLNKLKQALIDYKIDLDARNGIKLKEEMPSFNYDENDLKDEHWKEYIMNKKVLVSNYGRIKVNGKIEHQKDLGNERLVLDREVDLHKQGRYIYTMVAETFLGKEDGDGYDVHHITNNGLDNSVSNLVLLTREEHNFVHNFNKKGVD